MSYQPPAGPPPSAPPNNQLAVGAIIASVLWFSLLGYAGRLLIPVFQQPRAWRVLDAAMAAFMLVLAVRLLANPIT